MNLNQNIGSGKTFVINGLAALLLALLPFNLILTSVEASAASMTITEIVAQSGGEFDRNSRDYDILLNAVLTAGLEDELNDSDGNLTVFAPTDRAFIHLAQDLGFSGKDEAGAFEFIVGALTDLGGGSPIPVLTNVLLYHVSPGAKSTVDVSKADVVDTLLFDATVLPQSRVFQSRSLLGFKGGAIIDDQRVRLRVTLVDNDPEFQDPRIISRSSNIKASNGIIHSIDRVLIPIDLPGANDASLPTITEIVAASGGDFDRNSRDFDILLNAVLATNLQGALGDRDAHLTVFAPNDRAFVMLARALGFNGYNEGDAFTYIVAALTELGGGTTEGFKKVLTDVLLYHVSPMRLTVKDVVLSDSVATLLQNTTFEPAGTTLMDNEPAIADPVITVKSSNIQAANGRIHTINGVLIPLEIVD